MITNDPHTISTSNSPMMTVQDENKSKQHQEQEMADPAKTECFRSSPAENAHYEEGDSSPGIGISNTTSKSQLSFCILLLE